MWVYKIEKYFLVVFLLQYTIYDIQFGNTRYNEENDQLSLEKEIHYTRNNQYTEENDLIFLHKTIKNK